MSECFDLHGPLQPLERQVERLAAEVEQEQDRFVLVRNGVEAMEQAIRRLLAAVRHNRGEDEQQEYLRDNYAWISHYNHTDGVVISSSVETHKSFH
jgi:hypothetical protein